MKDSDDMSYDERVWEAQGPTFPKSHAIKEGTTNFGEQTMPFDEEEESIFSKIGTALKRPTVIAAIKATMMLVGGFLGIGKVFEGLDWDSLVAALSLIILTVGEVTKTIRTQKQLAAVDEKAEAAATTTEGLPQ